MGFHRTPLFLLGGCADLLPDTTPPQEGGTSALLIAVGPVIDSEVWGWVGAEGHITGLSGS
jgi:hypothetical protein